MPSLHLLLSIPDAEALHIELVADDPLVRVGLTALLASESGYRAASLDAPPDGASAPEPDVVLWDLGVQGAREDIRGLVEHIPTVALLPDERTAVTAWAAGAQGLLPRDAPGAAIVAALVAVHQGLVVLDPRFAEAYLDLGAMPSDVDLLTPREQEVFRLLAEGLPNKLIADRLGISESTVRFHIGAILGKLGVSSRTEAVIAGLRHGILVL